MTGPADRLIDTMDLLGLVVPTWAAWRTLAKVLDGLPLTAEERRTYEACTGRSTLPPEPPREVWIICGRRAGKSRFTAAAAVQAMLRTYTLAPGETAVVGLAAVDRDQARILLEYVAAPFRETPDLRSLVTSRSVWASLRSLVSRETRWTIDLHTGVSAEVRTFHYGRIRGRTFVRFHGDELAFVPDDETGANPAHAVLTAIRPALATLDGQLFVTTSPHAKVGVVWDAFTRSYGVDDPHTLVWRAPTRTMNPSIPEAIVTQALERDEEAARREWLAEFSDRASGLLTHERLRACVIAGRTEDLVDVLEVDHLVFVDPATGSGTDSMTLAVTHVEETEDGRLVAVVDALREARPPFNPQDVVREFALVCRAYGVDFVHGDRFAAGWTDDAFRREGVEYRPAERTKSELYLDFLRLVNARQVELPDHPRLLAQAVGLQRSVGGGGRERVDHGAHGAHDDLINAVAGACVLVHRLASIPRAAMEVW